MEFLHSYYCCIDSPWGGGNSLVVVSSCVRMHLLCTCILFSLLMVSRLVSATVSNSFKDCSHFFYMQTPPTGIRGASLKRICQKFADKLRYATLYDSRRHLPLYSAYVFKKSDGKRRVDTPWMYEPQVGRQVWCLIYLLIVTKLNKSWMFVGNSGNL